MRIAMYGSGGVGGYYGARLQEAGNDVVFIARGSHLHAMRTRGLQVSSIKGDVTLARVQATDDPGSVGVVDAVFLAVKTWQLQDAVPGLRSMVGPNTVVVPLLNGVEAADELVQALGPRPVLKGLTKILSFLDEPGHIRHLGAEPTITFGEMDSRPSERTAQLLETLQDAGIRAIVPDDIDAALWEKFVFVVSVGGVGAVTRAPIGQIRADPRTRAMQRAAMDEIVALAAARGVSLPADVVDRSMGFIDGLPEGGSASLQRDLAAGRPSELEAWNGAVVRLGEASAVPTPVHGFIYTTLAVTERKNRGEAEFSVPGQEPDPFRQRFLDDVAVRFRGTRTQAERAIAQVSDTDYFRVLDPESNSIAMLVKHLAGNHRSRWTDFLDSDGEKPDRLRDTEFEVDEDSREALTAAWDAGWEVLFESLAALTPADLDRTVTIRGEPLSVEQALGRSLAHAASHVGQIVLLAKHLAGSGWQTLSIPRGQSEAWLRDTKARFG